MFALISKLIGSTTGVIPAVAARKATPRLEALEDRMVMSATVVNGDLVVNGSNSHDTVTVNYVTFGRMGYYKVVENGVSTLTPAGRVTGGDVVFYGYDGHDRFHNMTGLRTHAYGMGGNDTLVGGNYADMLDGGAGSDHLYGNGGNDTLRAGYDFSYNYLDGGSGDDTMYGGYGRDVMYGQNGNDRMYGSWGNDYLSGGYGVDRLYGEQGSDTLDGGDDGWAETLVGGPGADWFQQDLYTVVFWTYNADEGADFNAATGDIYYNVR